ISLAIDALNQMGEKAPWRHVIVGRSGIVEGWGAQDTVVVARKPLDDTSIARARDLFRAAQMEAGFVPGQETRNLFYALLHSPSAADYQRAYTFDISPVSDNRPFFFYSVQPRDLLRFFSTASRKSADYQLNKAVPLLFALLGVSLFATVLI